MTERLLVRDLMTVGVETCPPDASIQMLAQHFVEQNLEGIVVLDEQGHGIGVITQDELISAYATGRATSTTAEDIMLTQIPQIPADIALAAAAQLMQDEGVRVYFMMHHSEGVQYPAAAISYRSFLRHLAATDDSQLGKTWATAPTGGHLLMHSSKSAMLPAAIIVILIRSKRLMPVEIPKDSWAGQVKAITLGATAADGGTRSNSVTVGGQQSLPFMHFEHPAPHPPRVAVEIKDRRPDDWSELLLDTWSAVMDDPGAWANAAQKQARRSSYWRSASRMRRATRPRLKPLSPPPSRCWRPVRYP